MKTIGVAVSIAFLGFLFYIYVILPVSLPEFKLRYDWNKDDLSWRDEDITWFLHVTDFHISKYVHPDIRDSLEDFFSTTLDTIKPSALIASGDLTDGKDFDGVDSFQVEEEWTTYLDLITKHNVLNKTLYLDIRGNHDSFDVADLDHSSNKFNQFSVQGKTYPSTYHHILQLGNNKTLAFIGLDATMKPGPKKVFNFLGYMTEEDYDSVRLLKDTIRSTYAVYFGHFPSSCIVAPSPGFRDIIQGGLVYLSGHLHTLGGFAEELYSLHRIGTPELELGDWKENRRFRLLAIDNGILTFSDYRHGQWPLVQITNPKSVKFLAPEVEPVQKIRQSRQIRILAFSPASIRSVRVKVDEGSWRECEASANVSGLYAVEWDPSHLASRSDLVHTITVIAEDGQGQTRTVTEIFLVDMNKLAEYENSANSYHLYARIILMSNVFAVFKFIWLMGIVFNIVPLLLGRFYPVKSPGRRMSAWTALSHLLQFSTFYYLLLGVTLLVSFGPWHAGQILSNQWGIVFPWTVFVAGNLLPSFYPYVFSFVHLFFFQAPLIWSLAFKFKWRIEEKEKSKLMLACSNIPVTLVLSAQGILLFGLYFYPSRLGILREIAILILPMEAFTIVTGFVANALASFYIQEIRKGVKNS